MELNGGGSEEKGPFSRLRFLTSFCAAFAHLWLVILMRILDFLNPISYLIMQYNSSFLDGSYEIRSSVEETRIRLLLRELDPNDRADETGERL